MGITHSVGTKEGWVTADLCGLSEVQCDDPAGFLPHTSFEEKRDVRLLLGMAGYYRKFIASYSMAAPLTDRTRKELPDKVSGRKDIRNPLTH